MLSEIFFHVLRPTSFWEATIGADVPSDLRKNLHSRRTFNSLVPSAFSFAVPHRPTGFRWRVARPHFPNRHHLATDTKTRIIVSPQFQCIFFCAMLCELEQKNCAAFFFFLCFGKTVNPKVLPASQNLENPASRLFCTHNGDSLFLNDHPNVILSNSNPPKLTHSLLPPFASQPSPTYLPRPVTSHTTHLSIHHCHSVPSIMARSPAPTDQYGRTVPCPPPPPPSTIRLSPRPPQTVDWFFNRLSSSHRPSQAGQLPEPARPNGIMAVVPTSAIGVWWQRQLSTIRFFDALPLRRLQTGPAPLRFRDKQIITTDCSGLAFLCFCCGPGTSLSFLTAPESKSIQIIPNDLLNSFIIVVMFVLSRPPPPHFRPHAP